MKTIFAGTPEFAARVLQALLASRHEVLQVLTRPDRRAGRGLGARPSAVKALAAARGLPLAQPASLRDPMVQRALAEAGADIIVVAAYGLLLPQAALDLAPLGAINVHASLLPRWRGAAPIARAVLAGDTHTGISIMQMDAGLDTGPILLQSAIPIGDEDDAGTLHDAMSRLGAQMLVQALDGLEAGTLHPRPQPSEGACGAEKIDKREANLNWTRPALEIWRRIRGFNPVPGARTRIGGVEVKLWRAHPCPGRGAPGEILAAGDAGIEVACADGALRLLELQRAGGRRLSAAEYLRGHSLKAGQRFEERID